MNQIMRICMKLSSDSRRMLVDEMHSQMSARKLSFTRLAQISGVDQSQISRVLAGDFKSVSHNVMQICMNLGIDPLRFVRPTREDEAARRRIMDSALAVWDGTPEGADLLVSVLGGMAALRGARRR
jgi:transcriptional regulator with XRE-family HTH domain